MPNEMTRQISSITRRGHRASAGADRRLDRAVAAADVVADTRRHHDGIGGHHAANPHRIALVIVGAEHAAARFTGSVETAFKLLERDRVNLAKGDQLTPTHTV